MNYSASMLTSLARAAIAEKLNIAHADNSPDVSEGLKQQAATFVTLHKQGQLRGCIGTLEAYRPLIDDVQANAIAAAFHDPRFPALVVDEFDCIEIEVSLLTEPQLMQFESQEAALSMLQPHIDGVVLRYGPHRATFLPQVWEQLPQAAQFMAHLKLKAGLPADFWHADMILSRYQVDKYCEDGSKVE